MKVIINNFEINPKFRKNRSNKGLVYFLHLAILLLLISLLCSSCSKQDQWLDKKKNNFDVIPTNLKDYQAILDASEILNFRYTNLGIIATDNYYLSFSDWQANGNAQERNSYIWAKDIYEGEVDFNWQPLYERVMYANVVLDGINKIKLTNENKNEWNSIRGSALFFRAYMFYQLIQVWAKPYDETTAKTDLGIPLRLSADVNIPSIRNNVQEVYDRIAKDLKEAILLLPSSSQFKTRPNKAAANGLLARVFLGMGKYPEAGLYADSALNIYNSLIDFNNSQVIDLTRQFSFPTFPEENPEIIFYSEESYTSYTMIPALIVDTLLYDAYSSSDLRKTVFYFLNDGMSNFKGSYTGMDIPFSGVATNELHLISAEAHAREGDMGKSTNKLNTLLSKRYKSFSPITTTSLDSLLSVILMERRKELPFTGMIRWEDLRRLNKDSRFATTLRRTLNGQTYTLPPNDNRYVYPIPKEEIKASGLQQNIR